jgi:hypothetical protein
VKFESSLIDQRTEQMYDKEFEEIQRQVAANGASQAEWR